MCILMDEATEKKQALPERIDIAKEQETLNLLYKIHTILISTYNRFVSIEFKRKKGMEEFCKDELSSKNFETIIHFHPDFKPKP